MLKIAVLISGGGTNLQSIIDASENDVIDAKIISVISNNESAFGIERAKKHNIKALYIGKRNYPIKEKRMTKIIKELKQSEVDLIVLAGYLEILSKEFFELFRGKIINIHPSLIPKYCGKGYYGIKVHEDVIKNNEKYSGATVHFVDEGVDTGQIIIQEALKVSEQETSESLKKRILNIEHKILIRSIEKIINTEI